MESKYTKRQKRKRFAAKFTFEQWEFMCRNPRFINLMTRDPVNYEDVQILADELLKVAIQPRVPVARPVPAYNLNQLATLGRAGA